MTDLFKALDLFRELNDLKRIFSAGRTGSLATRLFAKAWAALTAGRDVASVAGLITGKALAAARLGDIDAELLVQARVSVEDAERIVRNAMQAAAGEMWAPLRGLIEGGSAGDIATGSPVPDFVLALSRQPRAGVTCPGRPRIIMEPPENHADHCLMVAIYGVLLAPSYDADPARVFLAALAHHFHNAGMPDAGFTGEVLLGPSLETLMRHFTQICLQQLAANLRRQVEQARNLLPDANTPEGRAFHAADVLDRVLQLTQYSRAATLTLDRMLGEMELVHAGPVKAFQDEVLRQAGLS